MTLISFIVDGRDYNSTSGADTFIEGDETCIVIPIQDNEICDGKRHFLGVIICCKRESW